jgi:hypothetical protein
MPSSCPYSPECVEVEFSEVRAAPVLCLCIPAQHSLVLVQAAHNTP